MFQIKQLFFNCFILIWLKTSGVKAASNDDSVYKLTVKDIKGSDVSFKQFRGKVVLIVNVATYCNFARTHYSELVKMKDILGHGKKFEVLAFPCNQFGDQEPDTDEEINEFLSEVYKVNFPVFKKSDVSGENSNPVYRHLAKKAGKPPAWNFWKYLIDHNGNLKKSWGPEVTVEEIFGEVEAAVKDAENVARKQDL